LVKFSVEPARVAARFERIGGADRDVELLFVVAVHVAEPHVEGAVGIDVEPFVHRCDALSRPVAEVRELRGGLLGEQRARRDRAEKHGDTKGFADHAAIIGLNS